jgi:hypothetical protein
MTVSSTHYISIDLMISAWHTEKMEMWSWPNCKEYHEIFLEGLRKTRED